MQQRQGERKLATGTEAPAAICSIRLRSHCCRMALICTYGLYIYATSCHHFGHRPTESGTWSIFEDTGLLCWNT